ncbi:two-component regulator propeller domain-containing protein [Flexithrix dorotheae]|uniref:two-component regulator propeller domain-containing protein n=1 Tax=Flexithrix dorotheae TaxID=70993 RepID=UPI000374D0A6|nr:two-component regulator propeller domain-containing protein [Flexithrix dorotheae]
MLNFWLKLTLIAVYLIPTLPAYHLHGQELKSIAFEQLNSQNGLSNNIVTCIFQDSEGFIWVGTENGLNKFDGYNFKVYRHDPTNPNSISDNKIRCIYEDKSGSLWIGTYGGGINILPKGYDDFKHIFHNPDDPESLSFDEIISFFEDSEGEFWIGTDGGGINNYNWETGKFKVYKHQSGNLKTLSHNNVLSIGENDDGKIWVGTWSGLNLLDKNTGEVERFIANKDDRHTPENNNFWGIENMGNGEIWLGTSEHGGEIITKTSENNYLFRKMPFLPSANNNQRATFFHCENDSLLWIGSYSGLLAVNPISKKLVEHHQQANHKDSLQSNHISCFFKANDGIIWLGSNSGLFKIDPNNKQFNYLLQKHNPLEKIIHSLHRDETGNIWAGNPGGMIKLHESNLKSSGDFGAFFTLNSPIQEIAEINQQKFALASNTGMILYDTKNNSIISTTKSPEQLRHHWDLRSVLVDQNNEIWAGSVLGLNHYDSQGKLLKRYENDPENPESLVYSHHTSVLFKDSQGTFWVGTYGGGISKFDPDKGKFSLFSYKVNDPSSISNNFVETIFEDSKGNLWIGTHAGLNKWNEQDSSFQRYSISDGFSNDRIHGILEDDHGNLWLSTEGGIIKFNYRNNLVRNYDEEDGLLTTSFLPKSSLKLPNGEMLFGCGQGILHFHPDSIQDNPSVPKIAFTGFNIFNEPVPITEEGPLSKPLNQVKSITLNHNQSTFSFEYVALNYSNSKRNQYTYKLENFDKNWSKKDTEKKAKYTNIPPGEYKFRVKASNNDGIWNEEGIEIKIVVLPPFWKTKWAYFIYTLLLVLLLFISYKLTVRRERIKGELQMERLKHSQSEELHQLKLRFFTNISHEIRTPLTLILGPLENMLSSKNPLDEGAIKLIYKNAQKLKNLVNQLMDFRKLEAGKLKLSIQKGDLVMFIKNIHESFQWMALDKNIDFDFLANQPKIWGYFDGDKLDKVLTNLISNAFKFTANGGKISLQILISESHPDQVKIIVSDNGEGISEEKLNLIFKRFYQEDNGASRYQPGTGIGLSLSKELVKLHKGKLEVSSKKNEGTTFSILIPIGKSSYLSETILGREQPESKKTLPQNMGKKTQKSLQQHKVNGKHPQLLIAEDNEDIFQYISEEFKSAYEISWAKNGREGLELAQEKIPDLIISDIMMPEMDGIEFCSQVKTDKRTCHIPLILLTARSSQQHKLEGLENGADDYVVKPFNIQELKARVKNQITSRQALQQKFNQNHAFAQKQPGLNPIDQKLLDDLIKIVNKNLTNAQFGVEVLCKEVGISRPQLYRKLQALTGQSVNEFIRNIRLKKAAELLQQGQRVSDTAYDVGFNDLQYFSRCFRKKYGMPPKQFSLQGQ